jgi:DNA (cytosine-5)-methyltransferase 1
MRYLSVCSGIEAASVAAPEGWHAAAFAEVDPFPSAVLAHRFPTVPNLGDFTKIEAHHVGAIDLLVGGTPCQSFSIAGQRLGLDDPRGNLTLEYLALAGRLRPRWIVWENVPGVLSIDGGRTFGAFLGALGQLGYGFAYRVLDAQHFGVPQRRRRVFVVGCAGGQWKRAAAVLFEPDSLRGNPAAGSKARQDLAGSLGANSGGADDNDAADGRLIAQCLTTGTERRYDAESETLIAFDWQGGGNQGDLGASLPGVGALGTTKTPAVFAVAMRGRDGGATAELSEVAPALRAAGGGGAMPYCLAPAVFDAVQITSKASDMHAITSGVRRLMPVECERLQGFPDGWTDVPVPSRRGEASRVELARLGVDVPPTSKPAADGPRYKAIGNSMAVPVMRWIFNRLDIMDKATAKPKANAAGMDTAKDGEQW